MAILKENDHKPLKNQDVSGKKNRVSETRSQASETRNRDQASLTTKLHAQDSPLIRGAGGILYLIENSRKLRNQDTRSHHTTRVQRRFGRNQRKSEAIRSQSHHGEKLLQSQKKTIGIKVLLASQIQNSTKILLQKEHQKNTLRNQNQDIQSQNQAKMKTRNHGIRNREIRDNTKKCFIRIEHFFNEESTKWGFGGLGIFDFYFVSFFL